MSKLKLITQKSEIRNFIHRFPEVVHYRVDIIMPKKYPPLRPSTGSTCLPLPLSCFVISVFVVLTSMVPPATVHTHISTPLSMTGLTADVSLSILYSPGRGQF